MYDASTQTLHTTYTFTNDKILVPVVDFSRNKLIVPATELYENVTDKARDAALRACDLVSQNVAMGTAYADEKFQVLNLLQKALDMSRDMDARVGDHTNSGREVQGRRSTTRHCCSCVQPRTDWRGVSNFLLRVRVFMWSQQHRH